MTTQIITKQRWIEILRELNMALINGTMTNAQTLLLHVMIEQIINLKQIEETDARDKLSKLDSTSERKDPPLQQSNVAPATRRGVGGVGKYGEPLDKQHIHLEEEDAINVIESVGTGDTHGGRPRTTPLVVEEDDDDCEQEQL